MGSNESTPCCFNKRDQNAVIPVEKASAAVPPDQFPAPLRQEREEPPRQEKEDKLVAKALRKIKEKEKEAEIDDVCLTPESKEESAKTPLRPPAKAHIDELTDVLADRRAAQPVPVVAIVQAQPAACGNDAAALESTGSPRSPFAKDSSSASGSPRRCDINLNSPASQSTGPSTPHSSSILLRAATFEKGQQPTPSPPLRFKPRTVGSTVSSSKPRRRLANITEQKVLKTGVQLLHALLAKEDEVGTLQLPKNADGSEKVSQGKNFLDKLLKGQLELKTCMGTDVCSAQSDIRHLSVEQLLEIRSRTLDFATESASHSAHNNFLETVDKHLFTKLSRRCARGSATLPAKLEPLHALGLRVALTVGGASLLSDGHGSPVSSAGGEAPLLPALWVVRLQPEEWPDQCRLAILHVDELWLEPVPGEAPDLRCWVGDHDQVAVICDRTTGVGKERMLYWEISVVEPRLEAVLEEMGRSNGTSKTHVDELSNVLARRSASEPIPVVLTVNQTKA